MKCSNCGAEMSDTDLYCAVCGKKAEGSADMATDQVSEQKEKEVDAPSLEQQLENEGVNAEESNMDKENQEEPQSNHKKSLRFKLAVAGIIVAVLAVGVAAGAKVYGIIKKSMMSPTEYYQYVEKKNRDENMEKVTGYYDVVRDSALAENITKKVDVKLKASDTVKSLIALTGVDLSKIDDVELSTVTGRDGNAYALQMQAKLNGENQATLKSYTDLEEKECYLQIPELTESYLDASNALKDCEASKNFDKFKGIYDIQSYFPETDDLSAIATRYTDIAIENAENVKKADKKIEANNISQEVSEYTVKADYNDGIELCKDILSEAKDDPNIRNIIEKFSDDVYSEYQDGVKEGLEQLKDVSRESNDEEQEVLTLKTYVDDETIVGRELTIGQEEVVISYLVPRDGDKFGYEFTVTCKDKEYLTISGSGEEDKDNISGEFTVGIDESIAPSDVKIASYDKILKLKVEKCDMSGISDGKFDSTFILTTDVIPQLANYSLKVDSKRDSDKEKSVFSVMAGKDELVELEIRASEGGDLKIVKPSNSDTIYDVTNDSDMTAYAAEISLDVFWKKLKDKTGIDFDALLSNRTNTGLEEESSIDGFDSEEDNSYGESSYDDDIEEEEDYSYDDFTY